MLAPTKVLASTAAPPEEELPEELELLDDELELLEEELDDDDVPPLLELEEDELELLDEELELLEEELLEEDEPASTGLYEHHAVVANETSGKFAAVHSKLPVITRTAEKTSLLPNTTWCVPVITQVGGTPLS